MNDKVISVNFPTKCNKYGYKLAIKDNDDNNNEQTDNKINKSDVIYIT